MKKLILLIYVKITLIIQQRCIITICYKYLIVEKFSQIKCIYKEKKICITWSSQRKFEKKSME